MNKLPEFRMEMIRAQIEFFIISFLIYIIISFEDGTDLQQQHFTVEGLSDIIIRAEFISLYDVFLHRFRADKKQGNIRIYIADFFSKCKSVHMRHHYVEQTEVHVFALKCRKAQSPV